jgi:N-methylhydantoinase A
MHRVLFPRAAAGLSALGLMSADHVIDDSRGYISGWQKADLAVLRRLAFDLESSARAELAVAGVTEDRIELEWSLLLVYPGQTFDAAIPVDLPSDLEGAVAEFHRRNAEARLIEARAQEPMLRGVRLKAIGRVSQPAPLELDTAADLQPIKHRRMWLDNAWHDDVPVYDLATFPPGAKLTGPVALQTPFTTLLVSPKDVVTCTPGGDALVELRH